MKMKLIAVTTLASLLSAQFTSMTHAHTISWGFENSGPGLITVWGGSYHDISESPATSGQLLLTPTGGGMASSVPFTLAVAVRPAGLIDGTTNFYAGGMSLISTNTTGETVHTWQGATVGGLTPGNYTIQYDPAYAIPDAKYRPWDASISGGSSVFISGAIIGGMDIEAMESAIHSGVPFVAAERQALLGASRVPLRDVNARLFRLRTGPSENDPITVGLSVPVHRDAVELDRKGKPVFSKTARTESIASGQSPTFSMFANMDFGSADQDDIGAIRGFDGNTYAGTVGVECQLNHGLTLGIGGTYLNNNTFLNGGLGTIEIEGFGISTYLSWVRKNFYADVLYSFGIYNNTMSRNTLLGDIATGDAQGTSHTFTFNTGYDFHRGALTTGPIAGLEYAYGDLDGYSENGSPRGAVRVAPQSFDSLLLKLGWQASYRIKSRVGAITPQIRASWEHEFLDRSDVVSATLINSPLIGGPNFLASGNTSGGGTDYLALGAGCLFELNSRFSVVVDLETQVGRSNRTDSFSSIRGTYKF